ncbi:MAG: hypothetical protein INF92_13630 [Rhodobacter sp.]|nr:hypothetical protein [Rhodobacter sp.]
MRCKPFFGTILIIAALSAPLAAQTVIGADCDLCRNIADGTATVAPGPEAEDLLAAYQANQGAVTNCLDVSLLGDPQNFEPQGRWLTDVQTALDDGVWVYSSAKGVPTACGNNLSCLNNPGKITALFRVVFGQSGLEADTLSADEKATLTCRAIFADLSGAVATVEGR